ncbi:MAG: efflux RND transporter periplasmic adaptor subunit, partial [Spirochaetaceae bacterium]|nr:efflux RND transporter periplasmic adaptor subunit [Spirochaetaceae bacterium]
MEDKKNLARPAFRIIAFVVLGALGIAVIGFGFFAKKEKPEPFFAPVITITPLQGRLEKTIRISSQVETGRLITLVPRSGGTLVMLNAQPGREVAENEIIAQIDSAPYDLTYLQAQTAFSTARSTYERISGLYQNQAATKQAYEEARNTYEAARAQYEMAQLNLDYTKIRSPLNGVILTRHGTEGGLVDSQTPLVTLGDLADLRIKVAVPEIHYKFFARNWESMPVHMIVPALDTGESRALPDFITANEASGAAEGDSAAADNGTAEGDSTAADNGTAADGGATADGGAMTDSGMADNGAALSGGGPGSFALEPLSLAPYVSPENRSFLVEYRVPGGAERSL